MARVYTKHGGHCISHIRDKTEQVDGSDPVKRFPFDQKAKKPIQK